MKESARYVKIVEWSDEDQCFLKNREGESRELGVGRLPHRWT